jgi:toxin ParE1/3/4
MLSSTAFFKSAGLRVLRRMAERPAPVFLPSVGRDVGDILQWSAAEFGEAAAMRYEALIRQALRDVQADPERAGAKDRPDLSPHAYVYHLSFSRDRVAGEKVRTPRHFVLYRFSGGAVEFARILHDSRDLMRHLPE